MTKDLLRRRLHNQKLVLTPFRTPSEVVDWLGAVQAQDYGGACWALGQRGKGLTDAAVDRAFDEGRILRTHVLRPTWHFVTPRGRQFTYALLDERAPRTRARPREEALAELVRRYFRSHGPATVRDFAWWSGLTERDARAGLEAVKPALQRETLDERTYFFAPSEGRATDVDRLAHLLPNYDEYLIAYKDRGPQVPPHAGTAARQADGPYAYHLILGGRLAGAWKRTEKSRDILVEVLPYTPLTRDEERALRAEVERYGRFMAKGISLSIR